MTTKYELHDTLVGVAGEYANSYVPVYSASAPDHLRLLYLTPRQAGGARAGDRVELVYQRASPSFSEWVVSRVLR